MAFRNSSFKDSKEGYSEMIISLLFQKTCFTFFLKAFKSESLSSKLRLFHSEVPTYKHDLRNVSFLGIMRLIF